MKIHDLKPAPGSKTPRRRVGRGIAGKGGKTAGRGTKGQGARDNGHARLRGWPDAARTAARRRRRASRTRSGSSTWSSTSTRSRRFDAGTEVDPGVLRSHGLVAKRGLVKILGRGELTKALTVRAHAFSQGADRGHRGRRRPGRDHPRAVGRRPSTGRGNALTNR